MNQTNGDSKKQIVITTLSTKINEKGKDIFKVISGGKKDSEIGIETVEFKLEEGKLNANNTLEKANGTIVEFKGYDTLAKTRENRKRAIIKYKELLKSKEKEDNSKAI